MYINKHILNELRLDNKKEILLRGQPTIENKAGNKIIKYCFITSREFIKLDYYINNQRITVTQRFTLDKIDQVDLRMENSSKSNDRLFEINIFKKPILKLKALEESHTIIIFGVVFSLKARVEKFVKELNKANSKALITISFKRDDLNEACIELKDDLVEARNEFMFGNMSKEKKKKYKFIVAILLVVLALAFGRALLSSFP